MGRLLARSAAASDAKLLAFLTFVGQAVPSMLALAGSGEWCHSALCEWCAEQLLPVRMAAAGAAHTAQNGAFRDVCSPGATPHTILYSASMPAGDGNTQPNPHPHAALQA